jgi:hypothetical protein
VSGPSRTDLEKIGDRLEQVEAILAYEGALTRRLIAVRELLGHSDSAALPTRSMRKRWIDLLETMLKLDANVATAGDVANLLRQIENLRRAVRGHEADIRIS